MSVALVLGNGESRKNVDLNKFSHDVLIGCNAVYRDITVDHLVCCDKKMVIEAVNAKVNNIHSRKEWAEKFNVIELPNLPFDKTEHRIDQPQHWGSGTYAILLATTLANTIILLGFDLYGIETYCRPGSITVRKYNSPKVNNIYKNTKNYSTADSLAVDNSYWIYQTAKLFEIFKDHKFIVVNRAEWLMPAEWQKLNVEFVAL